MEDNKKAALTIDRAAFLLLRVKKVFRKKKQQRKEKNAQLSAAAAITEQQQRGSTAGLHTSQSSCTKGNKPPPPLLRSRTLPAIVVPGISILQAQIDSNRNQDGRNGNGSCSTSKYGTNTGRHSARISFSEASASGGSLRAEQEIGRRKSAVSRLCVGSAFGSPTERQCDGTLVLRVPAPHVVAARAYRMSASGASGGTGSGGSGGSGSGGGSGTISQCPSGPTTPSGSGSSTALYRLARLLNQGATKTLQQPSPNDTDGNVIRRLSWERRDTTAGQNAARLPRSSSIDSMVEAVWSETNTLSPYPPTAPPSTPLLYCSGTAPSTPRPLSLVSPSVGRRVKGQRSFNELPTINSSELLVDGMDYLTTNTAQPICTIPASVYPTAFTGSKHTKKQAKQMQQRLEKIAKINIHLRALFAAVEHGHLEKARTILESTDVDVNSVNGDGLSPLDVAVLSNNRSLTKMLVSFGAREGNQFSNSETLNNHLNGLLSEAELRLQELGVNANDIPAGPRASFSSIMSSAYPSSAMTGCTGGGDTDKQASLWGRRARGLQRLVLGLSQTRPPDPPQSVTLDITGTSTVAISFKEPSNQESSLTTKFKVQWATRPDFSLICGEREIVDLQNLTCYITDLNPGVRFYFRVACGNLKGYGTYKMSTPSSCIPSSWREVDSRGTRFSGRLRMLDDLFSEVKLARPLNTCELPSLDSTVVQNRRIQKKKTTIKQLFTAASKFQKHLRRGIFLACILYHEDKVLVTNEDFLPVIEIDETYPSCINTDYHWLMKVACTWDDVKSLRTDMEKNTSSAVHFRTKLLTAAYQMQSALCIQDLGQLFHKPLKDSQGTIVISTINYVKSPKSISVLNSRWLPLNKVHKKLNVLSEEHNVGEILMGSIQDQITYHQVSNVKLSKGLYLGYLKMQSSVELIQVVVPAKTPNVLPHCKIRENPHVTAEEWHYLKNYHNHRVLHKTASDPTPFIEGTSNEQQRTFLEQIRTAIKRLFNYMDLSMEHALTHRLYDYEVVELTNDVSFIIVCPSAEMACSVPGQKELLLQRGDLLSLPIQAFEMIHLNTYQNNIIQRYSRLSCVLELDNILANHLLREAFSTSELSVAKERLSKLSELQIKLNNIWKTVRWLMDAISFARERGSSNGILLRQILDIQDTDTCDSSKLNTNSLKRTLLQIPPRDPKLVKSSTSRGSWPGPGANTSSNGCLLNAEFSKSEQHLSIAPHDNSLNLSSHYLSANSDNETSRKSSLESYKHSDNGDYDLPSHRLPPSRSEDTLFTASNKSFHNRGRSKSSTIMTSVSASTSPLLQINAKPMYSGSLLSVNTAHTTNTSDSMHSLSSDSEGNSCPIPLSSSTPRKIKKHCNKHVIPSISMLNVKANIEPRIKVDNVLTNNVESNFIPSYSNLEITSSKSLTNIRSEVDGETKLFTKPTNSSKNEKYFKVPTKVDSATSSTSDASQPGILQVFAAYETGLASGTSLKLYVTPKTTAREVVDLVVKQLNMAVVLKGKDGPIYNADKLKNFCLVAVIGARERCLRDDFKPLQLQNPWKKGRLYVRQKQDVLAALEHSSKHSAIL